MDYNNKPILLTFKWTVSKGRDTYSYNICSLYVDGSKYTSTNGGGYDMEGTVLANYIVKEFQDKLMAIYPQAHTICTQNDKGEWSQSKYKDGLYGMSLLQPLRLKQHVTIDSACGKSSVERIAQACGLTLISTKVGKNNYGYFLTY